MVNEDWPMYEGRETAPAAPEEGAEAAEVSPDEGTVSRMDLIEELEEETQMLRGTFEVFRKDISGNFVILNQSQNDDIARYCTGMGDELPDKLQTAVNQDNFEELYKLVSAAFNQLPEENNNYSRNVNTALANLSEAFNQILLAFKQRQAAEEEAAAPAKETAEDEPEEEEESTDEDAPEADVSQGRDTLHEQQQTPGKEVDTTAEDPEAMADDMEKAMDALQEAMRERPPNWLKIALTAITLLVGSFKMLGMDIKADIAPLTKLVERLERKKKIKDVLKPFTKSERTQDAFLDTSMADLFALWHNQTPTGPIDDSITEFAQKNPAKYDDLLEEIMVTNGGIAYASDKETKGNTLSEFLDAGDRFKTWKRLAA